MKNKKKAFTLTELLVVVIVIGVLSAVVLPKFSKVIETRKTTEAEELMSSIRTEQEKRCALDKQYITDDISRLNDIVKNPDTKNYQLTLQGTGVIASSKGNYSYTLEMPSYADGRICCAGTDCEKLNKNYPKCEDLITKADYQAAPESCAGVPPPPEPDPEPACDEGAKPSDDGQKVACGGNMCGFQTVSYVCNVSTNYEWKRELTGTCVPEPPAEEPCPAGAVGSNRTDEWACLDGEWVGMAGSNTCTCDPAKKPQPQSQKCNLCGTSSASPV